MIAAFAMRRMMQRETQQKAAKDAARPATKRCVACWLCWSVVLLLCVNPSTVSPRGLVDVLVWRLYARVGSDSERYRAPRRAHSVLLCFAGVVQVGGAGNAVHGTAGLLLVFGTWRPSGAPVGVHLILDRSPSAPGAPRGAGWGGCRTRCGAGSRGARAAIAPAPKRENR